MKDWQAGRGAERSIDTLFVVRNLAPYGGERVLLALAEAMAGSGRSPLIVTIEPEHAAELRPGPGVARISLNRRRSGALGLVQAAWRLRRLRSRLRPEVTIGVMTYANLVSLASHIPRRRGLGKLVVSEHNILSRRVLVEKHAWATRLLVRAMYRQADDVLAVSDAVARDLASSYGVTARTVWNPVDRPGVLAGASAEPHVAVRPSRPGERRIVCVGALRPAKGHEVLLHAMALMREGHHELPQLIIVGDGELRASLLEQAARLGLSANVQMVGYAANPYPYIAASEILVVPSLWEGFGLVAVEGATLGKKLVVSRTGGLADLVPRILHGWLAEVGDAASLASALVAALSSDRTAQPSQDEADWGSLFDPATVAGRYLDVLQEPKAVSLRDGDEF